MATSSERACLYARSDEADVEERYELKAEI
jgi:hypothetical protein